MGMDFMCAKLIDLNSTSIIPHITVTLLMAESEIRPENRNVSKYDVSIYYPKHMIWLHTYRHCAWYS